MNDSLNMIFPYKEGRQWMFDDDAVNLKKEPFWGDTNTIIDNAVKNKGIGNAENGFELSFSSREFPNFDIKLNLIKFSEGGTWYKSEEFDLCGMLGSALFVYFESTPENLYVRLEEHTRIKGMNYAPTLRVSATPPLRVGRFPTL